MRNHSAYVEMFVLEIHESGLCGRSYYTLWGGTGPWCLNFTKNAESENFQQAQIFLDVTDHFWFFHRNVNVSPLQYFKPVCFNSIPHLKLRMNLISDFLGKNVDKLRIAPYRYAWLGESYTAIVRSWSVRNCFRENRHATFGRSFVFVYAIKVCNSFSQ